MYESLNHFCSFRLMDTVLVDRERAESVSLCVLLGTGRVESSEGAEVVEGHGSPVDIPVPQHGAGGGAGPVAGDRVPFVLIRVDSRGHSLVLNGCLYGEKLLSST